jgi:hypothetical protein
LRDLFGSENQTQTLSEELKAFENSLLKEIFGPEGKDVVSGWEEIT